MTQLLHRFRQAPIAIFLLLALVAAPLSALAQTPAASPMAGDLTGDIIPALTQQILDETADRLPVYRITGSFVPASDQPARIDGTLHLSFVNFTGQVQNEIPLRLYPNFEDYGGGSMAISNVMVDGSPAWTGAAPDAGASLVTIVLPAALSPGDRAEIALDFVTTIPLDPVTSYGMFGYFSDTQSYNLAQWMPLLAGWDPANGWVLDLPNTVGDPVFSNAAMFDIELTAPSDLTFVASGVQESETTFGPLTTHRWVAGPTRDFVMSAAVNLAVMEQQVGETMVRSWYFPGYEEPAALVLQYAVDAFSIFSKDFGPYPYSEMDLVQTRLGAQAAGVEFPGIMYIGSNHYYLDNDYLEFTVVHEVAHQWWYGIVGNNQYLHAFTDEALANASSIIYKEQIDGPAAAEEWIRGYLKRPFLSSLFGQSGDQIVDQPSADFITNQPYARVVYGKGALGFDTIRRTIGDDAFFRGLQQYVAQHRFGIAQPEDLLAALEAASGQDLHELWAHWFERTEGTQDFTPEDFMELVG